MYLQAGVRQALWEPQKEFPKVQLDVLSFFFYFFTNYTERDMRTAKVHLYADDAIIYSVASSLTQVVNESKTAFQQLQAPLYRLKLVLDAKK